MAFVLLIIGAVMVDSAVRNTEGQLWTLVKGDFEGTGQQHGFIVWFAAILVIGAVGYVPSLRSLSRVFLALVIVVLLISNKGFFTQFFKAIGTSAPPAQTTQPAG